jgi:exodeoxyribonuclease-3
MKIATFNINNIRKRLANLLEWLEETRPDVVCLQETKTADREFPADALRKAGYGAIHAGERSWNGVAILAKGALPIESRRGLPGDDADRQNRYIEAAVEGVLIGCLYAPNGNPQPGPKFDYKLAWHARFNAHAASLYASGLPVVLAGDYNVVPTDADIYSTRSFKDNALLQPESREAFQRLLDQGWTDALRRRYPREPVYTFWSYLRNRWPRDAGLRIDHVLVSGEVLERFVDAGVDKAVRGREGASDHAPVWIELR